MHQLLSKNQIKQIRSLKQKKYRYKLKKYLVEGEKMVRELLNTSPSHIDFIVRRSDVEFKDRFPCYVTDVEGFAQISSLQTPQGILAICHIPDVYLNPPSESNDFVLFTDGIQDPGNLGTIFRSADWFGIKELWIGEGTVDPYSPKVIQASMSSIFNLKLRPMSISQLIDCDRNIWIADMDGQNIYDFEWPHSGVLVLGNEGQGVSEALKKRADVKLSIPGQDDKIVESLNVAMTAMSILTLRENYFRKSG